MSGPAKKKIKLQPIQVYLRIRPFNENERHSGIESISTKEITIKGHPKRFIFDQVFNDQSSQVCVYKNVVGRMIPDVMKGYNCTVFAYGQTGTGKTFTMMGDADHSNENLGTWEQDSNMGCVLRAGIHIYDELKKLNVRIQHTVTVSFMEIYNEEIRDLLSDSDLIPLKIYEDKNKSSRVKLLTECTVLGPIDIYNLLKKGCDKRQTAATNLNIHSSRSHTVFTISVSTMDAVIPGSESITCGKLNLVDLAGSENIGKSGARESRAREAGSINQSLLTLGRVIKALVDNASHIPYRESKLTRILQDSLGGKTKTSIIATISPDINSSEETMSTLDYAYGARNITNCPQINVKHSTVFADLNEEILRLRKDLFATANEHGIYMDRENYDEMKRSLDQCRTEILEKHETITRLSENLEAAHNQVKEWDNLKQSFEFTQRAAEAYKEEVEQKDGIIRKERYLSEFYEAQGSELEKTAITLKNLADVLTERENKLQNKLSTAYERSSKNSKVTKEILTNISGSLQSMKNHTETQKVSNRIQFEKLDQTSAKAVKMQEMVKQQLVDNSNKLLQELESRGDSDSDLVINQTTDILTSVQERLELNKDMMDSLSDMSNLVKTKNKQFHDLNEDLKKTQKEMYDDVMSTREEYKQNLLKEKSENNLLKSGLEVILRECSNMFNICEEKDSRISNLIKSADEEKDIVLEKYNQKLGEIEERCSSAATDWIEVLSVSTDLQTKFQDLNKIQTKITKDIEQINTLWSTHSSALSTELKTKLTEQATEKQDMANVMQQISQIQEANLKEQYRELQECVDQTNKYIEKHVVFTNQLAEEYLKQIVPVGPTGDTPQPQKYRYPRTISAYPSRQSLLNKLDSEDKSDS